MTNPLFTTVGQVFLLVAVQPDSRVREIALHLGITERTVMHALQNLTTAGLVRVLRSGRHNVYEVSRTGTLSVGPLEVGVNELVALVAGGAQPDRPR